MQEMEDMIRDEVRSIRRENGNGHANGHTNGHGHEALLAQIEDRSDAVVNHPPHYNAHPSGVECIDITEHMNFNLGNAMKYIWRAGLKSDDVMTDLAKARWYLEREIMRLKKAGAS